MHAEGGGGNSYLLGTWVTMSLFFELNDHCPYKIIQTKARDGGESGFSACCVALIAVVVCLFFYCLLAAGVMKLGWGTPYLEGKFQAYVNVISRITRVDEVATMLWDSCRRGG